MESHNASASFGQIQPLLRNLPDNGPVLEIWPRNNADAILFYPGTMLAPGHYQLIIRRLWEAGLTVASPHLSGHGQKKKSRGFSFDSLMTEGITCEKWLKSNGFGEIAVSGHSQGGIMALAHAARSCGIKAAFPLCAIFPQAAEAIQLTRFASLAPWREQIMRFIAAASSRSPNLPVPLPLYLSLRKIMHGKKKPIVMGADKGRITYPLEMLHSLFSAKIPTRSNCPVTLFSARNDALFTSDLAQMTWNRINAPEKSLIWLEDGGHLAPFTPVSSAFIARHIAASCAENGMRLNTNL